MTFLNWVMALDAVKAGLLLMVVFTALVLWKWHRSDSEFHLQQVLVDNTTGKIAIEKVGYMASLAVGSWGFIALVLSDKMTEGYFTAYLGVFALARAASSGISVMKDIKMAPTAPAPAKD